MNYLLDPEKYVNKIGKIAIFIASGMLPYSPAAAANFTCKATPATYLAVGGSGIVYTHVENIGISGICSLSATVGTVTAQSCTGWYSALLTQRTVNKTVTLQYDDPGATGCASYSAWDIHAPYFFILDTTP